MHLALFKRNGEIGPISVAPGGKDGRVMNRAGNKPTFGVHHRKGGNEK